MTLHPLCRDWKDTAWLLPTRVHARALVLSGQQLTIGHEQRWDRRLRAVLDPAATDVQTGEEVWWGDDDDFVCAHMNSSLHFYEHMSACLIQYMNNACADLLRKMWLNALLLATQMKTIQYLTKALV